MRKVDKNTQDIDFVITWVDGNDLEWKREKAARMGHTDMDISVNAMIEKNGTEIGIISGTGFAGWRNMRHG